MKTKIDFLSKSYFYLALLCVFFSCGVFAQHGLHVEQGLQNNLAGGGMAVIGSTNSYRLKLDNNGIQAGNGASASTLYQNYWGGHIDILGAGNSTGNLYVDNGGLTYLNNVDRVGIGTLNPLTKLHVVGDILRLTDSGNAARSIEMRTDGAGMDLTAHGGFLYLNSASGEVRINNNNLLRAYHGIRVSGNTDGLAWAFGVNGQSIFRSFVRVESVNTTANALEGKLIFPAGSFQDRNGVYGENVADPNYGYGVYGRGGWRGVYGISNLSGVGTRAGLYGVGGNSTGTNYGVYATTTGSTGTRYAGYFSGNVTVTGVFSNPSDIMFKTEIESSDPVLEKVNQLAVKKYKHNAEHVELLNMSDKEQIGFIAQELQTIFPDLVSSNVQPVGDSKDEMIEYLGVNYIGMIPILTKGIQELSEENEELKKRLFALETVMNSLSR